MTTKPLDTISTAQLIKREKFSRIALLTVWLGASFAIFATCYRFFLDGNLPISTFIMVIIALIASIPVFYEKKQILAILEKREI